MGPACSSDPAWKDPVDAQMYAKCRDQHCLYQFLMALRDDFEPVRGKLLHHTHLPTLDQAVNELVRKKTRLSTLCSQHTLHTHLVLAARFPSASSSQIEHSDRLGHGPPYKHRYCRFYRRPGHTIDRCWRKAKSSTSAVAVTTTESAPSPASPSGESSGSTLTLSLANCEAIINLVLARSSNASSSFLSVLPGQSSSWLFDSACCNHITPYAS
jgi:hypothetical protein